MNILHDNPDLPPPRPPEERGPIDSLAKLAELNEVEIVQGYREGWDDPTTPIGKSKSYLHGWLNAQVDKGRMKSSDASRKLAHEYVTRHQSFAARECK